MTKCFLLKTRIEDESQVGLNIDSGGGLEDISLDSSIRTGGI